jgi:hypothetical protein
MKTINKIIAVLLLLLTMQVSASVTNKETLVNRMAENKNVKNYLEHRINALFISYSKSFTTNVEANKVIEEEIKKKMLASEESFRNIEVDFPEFAVLSSQEKSEIYKMILNTPTIAANVAGVVKCIGYTMLGYVTCVYSSLPLIEIWIFGGCFAAAVLADIVAIVAQPELLAALLPSLRIEAFGCFEVASATVVAVGTPSILANCATGTTSALFPVCLALL